MCWGSWGGTSTPKQGRSTITSPGGCCADECLSPLPATPVAGGEAKAAPPQAEPPADAELRQAIDSLAFFVARNGGAPLLASDTGSASGGSLLSAWLVKPWGCCQASNRCRTA